MTEALDTNTMDSLVEMEPLESLAIDSPSRSFDETSNQNNNRTSDHDDASPKDEDEEELDMDFSTQPTETTFSRLAKMADASTTVRKRRGFGRHSQTPVLEELSGLNEDTTPSALMQTSELDATETRISNDDSDDDHDSLSEPKRVSLDSTQPEDEQPEDQASVFSNDTNNDEASNATSNHNKDTKSVPTNEFEDSDDDDEEAGTSQMKSDSKDELDAEKNSHDDHASDEDDMNDSDAASKSDSLPAEEHDSPKVSDALGAKTTFSETNSTKTDLPDESDLMASVDHLFEQVPDKDKVTVTEIYQSLEAEFDCTLTKMLKKQVRERLKELVIQFLSSDQPDEDASSEDEEEDDAMSESDDDQEADAGSEYEQEDVEDEAPKIARKKSSKPKKASKSSDKDKKAVKKRSPPKRKASQAMKKKLSAVRKQAEQLRKKRMEELRVRNEEMQAMEQDESRAERIAAKLDTNTDEHVMRRFEKRVELVEKLAQKRIAVIQSNGEKHVELDDDSESSSDESEVEIVGGPSAKVKPLFDAQQRNHALGLLDLADRGARLPRKPLKKSSNSPMVAGRAALTARLKTQQRHMGNWWLARELNYSSVKDHVKECKALEEQKRLQTLQVEQERMEFFNKQLRNRLERGSAIDDEDADEELEFEDPEKQEGDAAEEEDEEAAMAKELQENQPISRSNDLVTDSQGTESLQTNNNEDDGPSIAPTESHEKESKDEISEPTKVSFAQDAIETIQPMPRSSDDNKDSVSDGQSKDLQSEPIPGEEIDDSQEGSLPETQPPMNKSEIWRHSIDSQVTVSSENDESKTVEEETVSDNRDSSIDEDRLETQPNDVTVPTADDEEDKELGPEESQMLGLNEGNKAAEHEKKPKGQRNDGWKAMLRADAERAKKEKRRKASGGGLVEEEADEEEEDQIAGLEDFGFKVKRKTGEDDDEENSEGIRKDDLEGVVDDLSDDEGDEEAGENARKAMEAKEERQRHKDMMQRMREGYDGRRGGIGSGTGVRGVHRFDQLTAAENREEAKRNGLLNEDEMDSDNESGGDDGKKGDDEEDETALLDKILKDRHLHRTSIQENFSDDEEETSEDDPASVSISKEDREEREQERLAKRFAKRARMQRLIELHGEEEEFSQARLIDEDTSLRMELQNMKNGLVRKRGHSSAMGNSQFSSSTNSRSASLPAPSLFGNRGRNTSAVSNSSGTSSNLFSGTSSALGLALQASRRSKPRLVSSWKSSDAAVFRTSKVAQPLAKGFTSSRGASNSRFASNAGQLASKKTGFASSSSLWANAVATKK